MLVGKRAEEVEQKWLQSTAFYRAAKVPSLYLGTLNDHLPLLGMAMARVRWDLAAADDEEGELWPKVVVGDQLGLVSSNCRNISVN
jgi:hypothetical protein